jgi:hypothetical protein
MRDTWDKVLTRRGASSSRTLFFFSLLVLALCGARDDLFNPGIIKNFHHGVFHRP